MSGEQEPVVLRPASGSLLGSLVVAGLIAAAGGWIVGMAPVWLATWPELVSVGQWLAGAVAVVLVAATVVPSLWAWMRRRATVDAWMVTVRGVGRSQLGSCAIADIAEVRLRRGPLGWFLGYASIRITSARQPGVLVITAVRRAAAVRDYLLERRHEILTVHGMAFGSTPNGPSVAPNPTEVMLRG